jgi:hypothetical protein
MAVAKSQTWIARRPEREQRVVPVMDVQDFFNRQSRHGHDSCFFDEEAFVMGAAVRLDAPDCPLRGLVSGQAAPSSRR